jgi:ATP-dependent Zn protease
LSGVSHTSATNSITFTEPNGTYNYIITLPSGYKTTSLTGTIKTTKYQTTISIPVSSTTSPSFNYVWIIVVVIIIIAVIGAVFALRFRKKKP